MLLIVGIAIFALFAAFALYVATRDPEYVISREILIRAAPEKIFPYLESTKRADEWMPWREIDPQSVNTFTGPDRGVGSRCSWDGGKKMGKGSATVVESQPPSRVACQLSDEKPVKMEQFAEYLVQPCGSETKVTWKVSGRNTFGGRLFCTFVNMDKMVGSSFEKGLQNLKQLTEK